MLNRYDPFCTNTEETGYGNETARRSADSTPQWMLTIADLFSLILTFFVLLYSMSSMQQARWEVISDSLQEASSNVDDTATTYTPTRKMLTVEQITLGHARNLDYLWSVMDGRFKELASLEGVTIIRDRDSITISLAGADLFVDKGTTANPKSAAALESITQFLNTIENAVVVEGYSHLATLSGTGYPSNWELSLARAGVVAERLRAAGYRNGIEVYGKGTTTKKNMKHSDGHIDIVVRENLANF